MRSRGRVRFVNRQRGYGFVESDLLPGDLFFAAWHVVRSCGVLFDEIEPGDHVSFELTWSDDERPQAAHLRVER